MTFAHGLFYGLGIVTVVMTVTAMGLWFERKFAARMQSRLGPTMVGPMGLLQPFADVVKLLQKEDIVPDNADRALFDLAPLLSAIVAIGLAAVVPFSVGVVGADLDIGVLFILAVGAVTVLPVFAAGWASNNKFALLGGMRAIAQGLAYEVPLLMAALVPVILAGSMNVGAIVRYQAEHHWVVVWPFFLGIPAFLLFWIAMLAESNRIPFDIPEAESELVAGVTTEYTGMKFALFYMAEYVHTLVASAIAAALFFGGWDGPFGVKPGPGAAAILGPGMHWMVLKTLILFTSVYWVRWSLLRFRSDQLMRMCWHRLVPLSVVLMAATATFVVLSG